VCVGESKTEHFRPLKEMNFVFAHQSSYLICPTKQSVSAKRFPNA
jgi:hypothetical protein